MKRILVIALMLSLVGTLSLLAQEVKPGKTGVIDLGNDVKLEMLLIPAGKFKMGDPGKDHEVTLTKPFYMGKYEVTQEQWEVIMGENPSTKKGLKLPVTDVSWNDCQKFIKKLNAKTNGGYRLPTEAEWEYACRAGTSTAYSFGDEITPKDANYKVSKLDNSEPVAVGSYKANGFGLYDMHGNVWEWCEDWKDDYPEGAATDPKGPGTGTSRVLRGGSFNFVESWACSSMRFFLPLSPDTRNFFFGFRLARTADIKADALLTVPKPDPAEVKLAVGNLLVVPFTETKAKEAQKEVAKSLQREVEEKADLGKGVNLDLVLIPAGKFQMGSPATEKGRNENKKQHEVTLTKPFYMGKYEVTQEQWEAVMGGNPSETEGARLPVTNISWEDCQAFIKKLNTKTKGGYRLPTEAEWEYACRAGASTAYSFGDKITPKDANYVESKIEKPVAVGSYKPNAFGLYDMHGNVWEWCEDWYGEYPTGSVTDPKGPEMGEARLLRGGSFYFIDSVTPYYSRNFRTPSDRVHLGGFRLMKAIDVKTDAVPEVPKPNPAGVIPAGNLLLAPFTETKAKQVQKEVAKSLQKEVEEKADLGKSVNLEMILIPAGKLRMSSPESEKGRYNNESQHDVTLTKTFYMGKYEVTQEQWEAVMGNNPSIIKGSKLPVTTVSWLDCQKFIKKLNAKTNGNYRLPTEAEWEYACRAGTTTAYSFGDEITPKDANYEDSMLIKYVAVGSYKPNAFGLYDMHGNVWECCEDWYGVYPEESVTDPKGPAMGTYRVMRGGNFNLDASFCRSSFRGPLKPDDRNGFFGLRLARTE
jgi:formylglycine-generating enzyme required for sulfatase activity